MQGKIIKGIAGFYYVHVPEHGLYECKAKGVFRKENRKPLVGDDVEVEVTDEANGKGNIEDILPRANSLIRPAVANIDQTLLIFATAKPDPSFQLMDRFLIMMRQQGLPCIICFNKSDLIDQEEQKKLFDIYANSECTVLFVSAKEQKGLDELKELLMGKTTTVAGPSGVGKSSLINCLQKDKTMETGEISEKIERGKHTTRHSELLMLDENSYIMDTPGFSSLSLFDLEKEQLRDYYPEFAPFENDCKFLTCAHIHEPVCGVKEALEQKKISRVRYDNYVSFYEDLKEQEKRKY